MSNGKRKGSQWERDVSKYLTEWLTNQKKEYYFWRSPGSGSVSTVSGTNPGLHGDIIPLKEEADKALCSKFVIECKNGYPSVSLDNFLKNGKNYEIRNFWKQVVDESDAVNKYPMLIYKKKGMSIPWLGITEEVFKKLFKNYLNEGRYIHLYWGTDNLPDIYFFDFYYFLDQVKPMVIKSIKGRK